jgi:hypothetical protein
MGGNDRIEWSAPEAVTDWQRSQVKAMTRSLWLFTTKIGWPLWAVGLAAAYIWGPQAYEGDSFKLFFISFFLLGLCIPALLTLYAVGQGANRLFSKRHDTYELNAKGLFCHSPANGIGVNWNRISRYRFTDSKEVSGVRVLEFTTKPVKYLGKQPEIWQRFYINPKETDEEVIGAFIEQHINRRQRQD